MLLGDMFFLIAVNFFSFILNTFASVPINLFLTSVGLA
jgi:hypothetical protein